MKVKIFIGIISIGLFFIGFNYYHNLLEFLLSFIPEVAIHYRKLFTQILQASSFGFTLSIIPILSFILWNKFKIEKLLNKNLIVLAFIISAFSALYVKTQFVKSILQVPFTKTVILESEYGFEVGKSIYEGENLNYSLYIFIAEIMTFTILHFVLNKNKLKEYNITE